MASSSGRQPISAALNRGRHRCSSGRPSRWALAYILIKTVSLLLIGVFHFTESTSYPDLDRLRKQLIDPQKHDLKSAPVASDRPMEEQIINVVAGMLITKVIAVVKTKMFLYYLG